MIGAAALARGGGAEISGNPEWLASALRKIDTCAECAAVPDVERHPATAHLFIVNPLHGTNLANLFATHPSTEERARRLEVLAAARGMGAWERGARDPRPWGARRPVRTATKAGTIGASRRLRSSPGIPGALW